MQVVELFLFTVDPGFARDCVAAGVRGVIVDWERRGKARRQAGEGTQINEDTPEDLARAGASFTFLRRSFWADTAGRDLGVEVPRILAACAADRRRGPGAVLADRLELLSAVSPERVAQPA